jgi:hypothetical protein
MYGKLGNELRNQGNTWNNFPHFHSFCMITKSQLHIFTCHFSCDMHYNLFCLAITLHTNTDVAKIGKHYWAGLNRLPDADKLLTATLTAPTAPSCHISGVNPLKSHFALSSRWTHTWNATWICNRKSEDFACTVRAVYLPVVNTTWKFKYFINLFNLKVQKIMNQIT